MYYTYIYPKKIANFSWILNLYSNYLFVCNFEIYFYYINATKNLVKYITQFLVDQNIRTFLKFYLYVILARDSRLSVFLHSCKINSDLFYNFASAVFHLLSSRRIYAANKLSRLRNAHTCGKESTRATFTKIESRHTKIEEMDTRINLSQVPFFLDENCILMCVHKNERKSRPSCLFVFSSCPPSHSRCNRSKNFVSKYFWMAAIDVYGFLRRFAVLEDLRVSCNCIFISLSFVSTSETRSLLDLGCALIHD